jgi:hypothetical protein
MPNFALPIAKIAKIQPHDPYFLIYIPLFPINLMAGLAAMKNENIRHSGMFFGCRTESCRAAKKPDE